jgi:hypothetical protein
MVDGNQITKEQWLTNNKVVAFQITNLDHLIILLVMDGICMFKAMVDDTGGADSSSSSNSNSGWD